jgi:hypothetical protein
MSDQHQKHEQRRHQYGPLYQIANAVDGQRMRSKQRSSHKRHNQRVVFTLFYTGSSIPNGQNKFTQKYENRDHIGGMKYQVAQPHCANATAR